MRLAVRHRRAGQYARSQARKHYFAFVRANLRLIIVMFSSVYLVTFVGHRLWAHEVNDVFVGAMLVVPLWITSLLVVGRPGPSAWARGADAEEWTSTALRRALPKGYRLLNDLQLPHGNADHVIVGPGGVFVVETKWRSAPWKSDAGQRVVRGACGQARNNARLIARRLASIGIEETPQPCVVLWGGGSERWATRTIERIPVVAGQRIKEWAKTLTTSEVTEGDRKAIVDSLLACE